MNSEINNIYNVCKHIADNKYSKEVNDLLVEELSELIKAVIKLERYNFIFLHLLHPPLLLLLIFH